MFDINILFDHPLFLTSKLPISRDDSCGEKQPAVHRPPRLHPGRMQVEDHASKRTETSRSIRQTQGDGTSAVKASSLTVRPILCCDCMCLLRHRVAKRPLGRVMVSLHKIPRPRSSLQSTAVVRISRHRDYEVQVECSPQSSCQIGGIKHKHHPLTGQCFEQLSSSPDREQSHCLLSHLYHNLGPLNPPHAAPPPVYHGRDREGAELDAERIRMGNLPVIPRTSAKRAICLINSLFCRSTPGPHPSSPPFAHNSEWDTGEVKGA
ncbi:unnamed protein product [Pleuronectes platessa]|uniref:Uncharacterized protein n=1 Tax=Pleuronectes platessa TaxID=8262 RepID=A0A9N7YEE8_PLEPL|nr:unnamed protein product [Pleuronectes platessa]